MLVYFLSSALILSFYTFKILNSRKQQLCFLGNIIILSFYCFFVNNKIGAVSYADVPAYDTAPFRLLFYATPLFKIILICYICTLLLYFCIQMPTILFHEAKHAIKFFLGYLLKYGFIPLLKLFVQFLMDFINCFSL